MKFSDQYKLFINMVSFIHSFIHFYNKHLTKAQDMPSTMLGIRGTDEKDRESAPEELMISWEIQTGT